MEIRYFGCDTSHQIGEFCKRKTSTYYFIACFSTPFIYESKGRLRTGNTGDFLITPPGSIVYHGPQSDNECFINDWIYVKGDDLTSLLEQYPIPFNKAFYIGNKNYLKNCIKKIQKEFPLKPTGYENLISCYLTEAIIHIHRLYQHQKQSNVSMSRIESIKEMVSQDLSKNWTLQEMAELSGYSVSHFSTLYAQRFGLSPKADLIDSRIQLAKQMLYYSEYSITEIARQCGFQNIYYFSNHFKNVTGMSPSEYTKHINLDRDDEL